MTDTPAWSHAPDAEAAYLGACIASRGAILTAAIEAGLTRDAFRGRGHAQLFDTLCTMSSDGEKIDTISILETLRSSPWFVDMGGLDWLSRLVDAVPTVAHAESWRDRIMACWTRRRVDLALGEAAERVRGSDDAEDPMGLALSTVMAAAHHTAKREEIDGVSLAREVVRRAGEVKGKAVGIEWPTARLRHILPPIEAENGFAFIMAPPSVGKTALALQMAMKTLVQHERRVDYIGLEGAPRQMVRRCLMNCLGLQLDRPLSEMEQTRAEGLAARMFSRDRADRIEMTARPNTIGAIRAHARQAKEAGSLGVFIDNMKHIRTTGQRFNSRVEQFLWVSIELKYIRDDVGIPIIVLHHSNDDGETRWSKDIDADADLSIKLLRDDQESVPATAANNFQERAIVDLDVAKNRDGETPKVQLWFQKTVQRFVDWPQ